MVSESVPDRGVRDHRPPTVFHANPPRIRRVSDAILPKLYVKINVSNQASKVLIFVLPQILFGLKKTPLKQLSNTL